MGIIYVPKLLNSFARSCCRSLTAPRLLDLRHSCLFIICAPLALFVSIRTHCFILLRTCAISPADDYGGVAVLQLAGEFIELIFWPFPIYFGRHFSSISSISCNCGLSFLKNTNAPKTGRTKTSHSFFFRQWWTNKSKDGTGLQTVLKSV
ncbi:hypothetical protein DFH06DRAFT_464477 [Mycena polygramma]|nr:hypothetical protein DFH06DRAFT_464477 [Mycena polygramma]